MALYACIALAPSPLFAAVVLNAVGDIMLGGAAAPLLTRLGYDYPFRQVTPLLRQGDLAMGNLEAPLSLRGEEFTTKRFRFRVPPVAGTALKAAGFSLVTLANNHTMDYGATALRDTLTTLAQQEIFAVGAGPDLAAARRPYVATVRGTRLAFLAYSLTKPIEFFATPKGPGTAPAIPRLFEADIRAARKMADHVVVSFHWGQEGAHVPTGIQRSYARRAIDAGAEVIIGHHPHVLQGMEYYGGGVILYSLGNFVFGSRSRTADLGAMARITLGAGKPSVELIPLDLRHDRVRFQPRPLRGEALTKAMARISRLSALAGGTVTPTGQGVRLVAGPVEYP